MQIRFLCCLLLNIPIFKHKDMTITRISEMFAFKLALYKYWSLPRLGSLLNFIFPITFMYLDIYFPLTFQWNISYTRKKSIKLQLYFIIFFWPDSSTLIQLAPGDLTHFKKLAVPDIRFWQLIIDVLHVNGKNFARVVYYQAQQKWLIKSECLMSAPISSYLIFTAAGRLSKMT